MIDTYCMQKGQGQDGFLMMHGRINWKKWHLPELFKVNLMDCITLEFKQVQECIKLGHCAAEDGWTNSRLGAVMVLVLCNI